MVEQNKALKRVLTDCEKGLSSNPLYTCSANEAERLGYSQEEIVNSRPQYHTFLRTFMLMIVFLYLVVIFDIVDFENVLPSIFDPKETRTIIQVWDSKPAMTTADAVVVLCLILGLAAAIRRLIRVYRGREIMFPTVRQEVRETAPVTVPLVLGILYVIGKVLVFIYSLWEGIRQAKLSAN
ncbi:hypothetical protein DL95DRAFT_459689 [Leptodontidium sp. 2 PMI_412]|nr:hypothetical protein DL95DRAFT_459689 [Leptodontidium sp. 2 PMI_412]